MNTSEAMTGGFADPVFQSQSVFRKVLEAFSRPGTIIEFENVVKPPSPLHMPAAAFICAFADEGTPLHVDPTIANAETAGDWIKFHSGAPIVAEPAAAAFAIVGDPGAMPALDSFSLGLPDYPDRSTTIVLQVDDFSCERKLRLEGPGIDGFAEIAPSPLPERFVEQMQRNRSLFPLGVDIVLASPLAVSALPRSIHISETQVA